MQYCLAWPHHHVVAFPVLLPSSHFLLRDPKPTDHSKTLPGSPPQAWHSLLFISTTFDQRGLLFISLVLAGEVDTIMDIGCVDNIINDNSLLNLPRVLLLKLLYLLRLLSSKNLLDVTRRE